MLHNSDPRWLYFHMESSCNRTQRQHSFKECVCHGQLLCRGKIALYHITVCHATSSCIAVVTPGRTEVRFRAGLLARSAPARAAVRGARRDVSFMSYAMRVMIPVSMKKHSSGKDRPWEEKPSEHQIRGWRAVSAAGLHG